VVRGVVWLPRGAPTRHSDAFHRPSRYCGVHTHAPPMRRTPLRGNHSTSLYARQPANCTHTRRTVRARESVGRSPHRPHPPLSVWACSGDADADRSGRANNPQRNGSYAIERVANLVSAYGPPSAPPPAAQRAPRVRTCGQCGRWEDETAHLSDQPQYIQGGLQGHALRTEGVPARWCGSGKIIQNITMAATSVARVVGVASTPNVRSVRQGSIVRYAAIPAPPGSAALDAIGGHVRMHRALAFTSSRFTGVVTASSHRRCHACRYTDRSRISSQPVGPRCTQSRGHPATPLRRESAVHRGIAHRTRPVECDTLPPDVDPPIPTAHPVHGMWPGKLSTTGV